MLVVCGNGLRKTSGTRLGQGRRCGGAGHLSALGGGTRCVGMAGAFLGRLGGLGGLGQRRHGVTDDTETVAVQCTD